ncbi:MAG: sodium-independent anion transporter [Polynucleobacter sp. 24-46-87]|jgi:SulP family sulfate permease|uniref:SulP family inorganic anion transporter n=1 Tax=unclassified Polynucleobacter TaxID=2640945 RepID=UPI000BCBEE00|nr:MULTISPECIES: SulP family inorganic anion transporter [unclassified Polynucleobacter]OYY21661.1 MAG: sodium-independent anion transporter [Polynucleobacter sp. 35-46-11]OZA15171.1 MAG: sodium-independent anion transporter [Polynucleobacter sp. 24-46-87]OZA78332.1 MAG: sodium-independent anion transporter [Polynucleobacter sp. 39-46-10]
MNLFHPKLLDSFKGYNGALFSKDILAGITVGVVALPLAMAFAIASGVKPEAGIFTAIIAGGLISLLGGSRVQIGGPAGAFIVIVYGIVEHYGLANLLLATAMSGVFLFLMGLFRLGTLIRFIPVAVIIGFTNGIAVLIGLSQIKEFFGLQITKMPAEFFQAVQTLYAAADTVNPIALILSLGSLALLIAWRIFQKRLGYLSHIPGTVIAMALATMVTGLLSLPVDTIGSRFGGIPSGLPSFEWIPISWSTAQFVIAPAITLALLGAIESLLCARIADGLIHDRHESNQELMAQGVANLVSPFFGGMPSTGTIARTVTNIQSGASTPIAGVVHAVTLLVIILFGAPLAKNIPLASLAAILMYVAWNMGEWRKFADLKQFRLPYRLTMLSVFFLTIVLDLTVAIQVGLLLAFITFIYRISSLSRYESASAIDFPELQQHQGYVSAIRIYGAIFFGAVKLLEGIEKELPSKVLVLDLKNVIYIDVSGMDALLELEETCQNRGIKLMICGLAHQPYEMAVRGGLFERLTDDCAYPDLKHGIATAITRINSH